MANLEHPKPRRRVNRRLVALLAALSIAVMAVIAWFNQGAMVHSKIKKAQTEVPQISNFVESYYAFQEALPGSLDDLVNPPGGMAPITREIPFDPWRRPYVYIRHGPHEYELYSVGRDHRDRTDDDIYAQGARRFTETVR